MTKIKNKLLNIENTNVIKGGLDVKPAVDISEVAKPFPLTEELSIQEIDEIDEELSQDLKADLWKCALEEIHYWEELIADLDSGLLDDEEIKQLRAHFIKKGWLK